MVSNVDVWIGWGVVGAKENMKQMPAWVAQSVHKECARPDHTWAMLVGVCREREALFSGERLPREVMGFPSATMDQATLYLERQAERLAQGLAWGDWSDKW